MNMDRNFFIENIETYIIDIPLIRPHVMSFGSIKEINFVLVKLITNNGIIGWGEAATLEGPTFSEECAETIKILIDKYLFSLIKGKNPLYYNLILEEIDLRIKGNLFAKAAVEFALLDIVGKYYKQPIYLLFGERYREKIPLSWSIASENIKEEIDEAIRMRKKGFKIFKVKVGAASLKEDVERIRILRKELGDSVNLRIDVNQGWDFITAIRAIKAIEKYNIDFVEQPLPKWDIEGLSEIRRKTVIPIMVDESLTDKFVALKIIKNKAADIFSFKLNKLGGIISARKIYSLVESSGLSSYVGCMIETGVGTSAYLQFAASIAKLSYGCELWGPLLLKEDIVSTPIKYEGGYVFIPKRNGLGVEIDEEKLEKYRRIS